jgi:hypothetical protein
MKKYIFIAIMLLNGIWSFGAALAPYYSTYFIEKLYFTIIPQYLFNDKTIGFDAIIERIDMIRQLKNEVNRGLKERVYLYSEIVGLKILLGQSENARLQLINKIDSLQKIQVRDRLKLDKVIANLKYELVASDSIFQISLAENVKLTQEVVELRMQVSELQEMMKTFTCISFEQGVRVWIDKDCGKLDIEKNRGFNIDDIVELSFEVIFYVPKYSDLLKKKLEFSYKVPKNGPNKSEETKLDTLTSNKEGFVKLRGNFIISKNYVKEFLSYNEVSLSVFEGAFSVKRKFTINK